MNKARKAVWAFATAALGSIVTAVTTQGAPDDAAGWSAVIGAGITVGIVAAVAVYRATNRPA